jgi:hypothetical protein
MNLTASQRQWLADEAGETLGLTPVRSRILTAILDRTEPFSMRGIGRETTQSAENVRLALDLMVARELIELQTLGDPRRPKASFLALPGRRLRMLFAGLDLQIATLSAPPMPRPA